MKRGFKVGDWVKGVKPFPCADIIGEVIASRWSSTFHGSTQEITVRIVAMIMRDERGKADGIALADGIGRWSSEWCELEEAAPDPRDAMAPEQAVTP